MEPYLCPVAKVTMPKGIQIMTLIDVRDDDDKFSPNNACHF